MHVSEDDLILHYYGEADNDALIERHMSSCMICRGEFARLRQVLALVDEQPVPEPSPGFERQVWARMQPMLESRRRGWIPSIFRAVPRWAFAGGAVAALLAAFIAGRVSVPPGNTPPDDQQAGVSDRVLLVAVVDHLDRSQMVLVELLNAELDDPASISLEQARARELVAANRLYRQSAAYTGDDVMGETLEDLERVLLEIANAPADVTPEDLAALREQIGPRGLLFRVRVVQSEMREKQRLNRVIG